MNSTKGQIVYKIMSSISGWNNSWLDFTYLSNEFRIFKSLPSGIEGKILQSLNAIWPLKSDCFTLLRQLVILRWVFQSYNIWIGWNHRDTMILAKLQTIVFFFFKSHWITVILSNSS